MFGIRAWYLGGGGREGGGGEGRRAEGAVITREATDMGRVVHTTLGILKLSWSFLELYIANVRETSTKGFGTYDTVP